MPFDFFTEYTRIHRQVYGRDPCTREQWAAWVRSPKGHESEPSDIEVDYSREREGDAQ